MRTGGRRARDRPSSGIGALASAVFPAPTASAVPRPRIALGYTVAFVAGLSYLVLIPAGRSHLFRMWAEDGKEWISDAARSAPLAHLLDPVGGYFHAVPRLIAELVVGILPVDLWAAGVSIAADAVRVLCALLVFHVARGHLPAVATRLAVAGAIVLLPAGNDDAIGNAANLHWFLTFTLCWVLLWRPASAAGAAACTALTGLLALSVPFAVVLLPLAALRFVSLPAWRDRLPALLLAVASAAVSVALLGWERPRTGLDPAALAASAAVRGPLVALVGPQATADLIAAGASGLPWLVPVAASCAALVIASLAAAGMAAGLPSERVLIAGALLLAILCSVLNLASNWQDFLAVDEELRTRRYSVLPGLLLITVVATSLGAMSRRSRGRAGAAACALAAIVIGGAAWQLAAPSDAVAPPAVSGITWQEGLRHARAECALVGDENVKVTILPHDAWTAVLPCDLLE